jgi:hypothetical protein
LLRKKESGSTCNIPNYKPMCNSKNRCSKFVLNIPATPAWNGYNLIPSSKAGRLIIATTINIITNARKTVFSGNVSTLPFLKLLFNYYVISGTITASGIAIEFWQSCPTGEDDNIYLKVLTGASFSGGMAKLAKELEPYIPATGNLLAVGDRDSALLFRIVIMAKDSLVHEAFPVHPYRSVLEKSLVPALKKVRPWLPLIQGGLRVNAYVKVFVRLLPNRRLQVDMCH